MNVSKNADYFHVMKMLMISVNANIEWVSSILYKFKLNKILWIPSFLKFNANPLNGTLNTNGYAKSLEWAYYGFISLLRQVLRTTSQDYKVYLQISAVLKIPSNKFHWCHVSIFEIYSSTSWASDLSPFLNLRTSQKFNDYDSIVSPCNLCQY